MFILRAVKSKKDDPFGFFPNDEYVYFYCKGLKDLRLTIRHITPSGYRVRSSQWFSKYIKMNGNDLILSSGFLAMNEKYRIIKIHQEPLGYETFEYTNNDNKIYTLKAFSSQSQIDIVKGLFS